MANNDKVGFQNPWKKPKQDLQPLLKELRLRKQRGDLYELIEAHLFDVITEARKRKRGRAEIIDAVLAIAGICASEESIARDELITFGNWLRREPLPAIHPELVRGLMIRITEAITREDTNDTTHDE